MNAPILVTGSHRSGTTWVGRMLALSGGLGYVHEPFNPRRRPGWTGNRIPYWYLYICPENERYYAHVIDDVMVYRYPVRLNLADVGGPRRAGLFALDLAAATKHRLRRATPLVKDPIALFSAGWMADRYGMRVVVMIRHPLAFASSLKRLNWRFKFRSWLAQPLLMRDRLHRFEGPMRRCWLEDRGVIDEAIVMWNAIHHVVLSYQREHPDWLFVRHEDLASDPTQGFQRIYSELGLPWSARVSSGISSASSPDNPQETTVARRRSIRRDSAATVTSWRQRLDPDEIRRVEHGTRELARHFYPDRPEASDRASA